MKQQGKQGRVCSKPQLSEDEDHEVLKLAERSHRGSS
jgi:hypothetical protein